MEGGESGRAVGGEPVLQAQVQVVQVVQVVVVNILHGDGSIYDPLIWRITG